MEMFQSFAQVVRDENDDWATMSKGDLLFQYSRNRWKRLRKEHFIDITRTIFQALGRGERRSKEKMPQQLIFVSSEAARTVNLGLKHVGELRRRASPAQRAVLLALEKHNQETAIFLTSEERKQHEAKSLKLAIRFRNYTSDLPKRFRSESVARSTWSKLFDRTMFTVPETYLSKLRVAGVDPAFLDACYFDIPLAAEAYTKDVSMAGVTEAIITDACDGSDIFNWVANLVPSGLSAELSSNTKSLLKKVDGFEINTPVGKRKLLPQPWFVVEIMKGYIAELEFEEYVRRQFGISPDQLSLDTSAIKYINLSVHHKSAELYQLYDYYLEVGDELVIAIDIKNWARSTDRLKKDELKAEADTKHVRIQNILPNKIIHAVYINLYGAHKLKITQPSRGSIRFVSLYVTNTIGMATWAVNENIAEILLGK
ncbi:hypothetical protein [Deefgea sp. CFH1-16]|uniref:hypothetical protein n=1 Tax=Deefgea sp. CFH1-16 TaxID=2675457 RepID=UPI0019403311|nr:hypothetical protein [Deefgea sp. CFH1-16]